MSQFTNKHALFDHLQSEVGDEVLEAELCLHSMMKVLEPAGTLTLVAQVSLIGEEEPFTGHAWDFDTDKLTQKWQTFDSGYAVYLPHMGHSFFAGMSTGYVETCLRALGAEIPSSAHDLDALAPGDAPVVVPLLDVPYYTVDNTLRQILQFSGHVRDFENETDFTDKPPFWERPELLPQVGDLLARIPDLFPLTTEDGVTVGTFNLYDMATAREIFLFPDADDAGKKDDVDDTSSSPDDAAAE